MISMIMIIAVVLSHLSTLLASLNSTWALLNFFVFATRSAKQVSCLSVIFMFRKMNLNRGRKSLVSPVRFLFQNFKLPSTSAFSTLSPHWLLLSYFLFPLFWTQLLSSFLFAPLSLFFSFSRLLFASFFRVLPALLFILFPFALSVSILASLASFPGIPVHKESMICHFGVIVAFF